MGCQTWVKDPSGSFTIKTVSHYMFIFNFVLCILYFNDTTDVPHNLIELLSYLNFLATWGQQKQAVNATIISGYFKNYYITHLAEKE